eukprot:927563-Pelagomonas_calceolata.AAC.4
MPSSKQRKRRNTWCCSTHARPRWHQCSSSFQQHQQGGPTHAPAWTKACPANCNPLARHPLQPSSSHNVSAHPASHTTWTPSGSATPALLRAPPISTTRCAAETHTDPKLWDEGVGSRTSHAQMQTLRAPSAGMYLYFQMACTSVSRGASRPVLHLPPLVHIQQDWGAAAGRQNALAPARGPAAQLCYPARLSNRELGALCMCAPPGARGLWAPEEPTKT